MGIPKSVAELLLLEAKKHRFKGKILTLGKQDCLFTEVTLKKLANKHKFKLRSDNFELSSKKDLRKNKFLSDVSFFKSLGFSEVFSLDYSTFENADIIFDLNNLKIPAKLREQFDVIFDGGTIEHVFNVPVVLNNLFTFLKQDGMIINLSPSSNNLDHGFYMFSPTLFFDYYTENKFEIETSFVLRYARNTHFDKLKIHKYCSGSLNYLGGCGGLDSALYYLFFVVKKTKYTTGNKTPQQKNYLAKWSVSKKDKQYPRFVFVFYNTYMNLCNRFPILYSIYVWYRGKGIKRMRKL